MSVKEITVHELQKIKAAKEDFFLLDVRSKEEHDFTNIGGYLIPLAELAQRLNEVTKDKKVVVYCRSGGRSHQAVQFLQSQGYTNAFNLQGGILAWSQFIDSSVPAY